MDNEEMEASIESETDEQEESRSIEVQVCIANCKACDLCDGE